MSGIWLLFIVVGAGTYLTRLVPLLIALRYGDSVESGDDEEKAPDGARRVLVLVGPAIIAALLMVSVVPAPEAEDFRRELLRGLLALGPTLLVAARWQNLGLTVLVGVCTYWLLYIGL
jgi:branched-subunit amino acid transport protein